MPPMLLCWPTTSEADVGSMIVEGEPSCQYSITFCCCVIDGSRGAVWQNGIWHGSAYEAKGYLIEFFHVGKKLYPLIFIDACWTFMETKQWMWTLWSGGWVMHFSSGERSMKDKPHSRWPCRFLQAQHAGSSSLLAKMHSSWWWLCWKIVLRIFSIK